MREAFKTPWPYLAIAGVAIFVHSRNRVELSVEGNASANPYEIHPNTATALGHGQDDGLGPVPPSYPTDPFDSLYQAGMQDSVQGRYSQGLFRNLNLTQKMLGLPYFTGECGPNCVKVYDPKLDHSYNWDPSTNSLTG